MLDWGKIFWGVCCKGFFMSTCEDAKFLTSKVLIGRKKAILFFFLVFLSKENLEFQKKNNSTQSPSKAAENSHQFDVRGKLESVT
jgi:hypothetical protein